VSRYPEINPGWSANLTSGLLRGCPSERSRSRGGRCRVGEVGSCGAHHQINFGSQGGPCDPSTKNHAGGTPALTCLAGVWTNCSVSDRGLPGESALHVAVMAVPHRQWRFRGTVASDWSLDLRRHRQHLCGTLLSDDRRQCHLCCGESAVARDSWTPHLGRSVGRPRRSHRRLSYGRLKFSISREISVDNSLRTAGVAAELRRNFH